MNVQEPEIEAQHETDVDCEHPPRSDSTWEAIEKGRRGRKGRRRSAPWPLLLLPHLTLLSPLLTSEREERPGRVEPTDASHHESVEGEVAVSSGHGSPPGVVARSQLGQVAREGREDLSGRTVVGGRKGAEAILSIREHPFGEEVVGPGATVVDFLVGGHPGKDGRRGRDGRRWRRGGRRRGAEEAGFGFG